MSLERQNANRKVKSPRWADRPGCFCVLRPSDKGAHEFPLSEVDAASASRHDERRALNEWRSETPSCFDLVTLHNARQRPTTCALVRTWWGRGTNEDARASRCAKHDALSIAISYPRYQTAWPWADNTSSYPRLHTHCDTFHHRALDLACYSSKTRSLPTLVYPDC